MLYIKKYIKKMDVILLVRSDPPPSHKHKRTHTHTHAHHKTHHSHTHKHTKHTPQQKLPRCEHLHNLIFQELSLPRPKGNIKLYI